jgi:hypothetical protein
MLEGVSELTRKTVIKYIIDSMLAEQASSIHKDIENYCKCHF